MHFENYYFIFFFKFYLKMQNWISKKEKKEPKFSKILGRSEKGKTNIFFLGLLCLIIF